MSWEPSSCPGSPSFDGGWAWEQYNKEMEELDMIEVRSHDGESEIYLTRVDHVTTAESAAQKLFDSAFQAAKVHGGAVFMQPPEERGGDGWSVEWSNGPTQWADAYVVSDGADAPGFVAEAEYGHTVVFRETD